MVQFVFKKNITLASFLFFFLNVAYGQKEVEKAINEGCLCVKEITNRSFIEKISFNESATLATKCIFHPILKNKKRICKELGINVPNDNATVILVIGNLLGSKIIELCPEYFSYGSFIIDQFKAKGTTKDINPDTMQVDKNVCEGFHSGKHRILKVYVENIISTGYDTNEFYSIEGAYLYSQNDINNYKTQWEINWVSECQWERTFVKSTNPKVSYENGEKELYTIVGSPSPNKIFVKTIWNGHDIGLLIEKF